MTTYATPKFTESVIDSDPRDGYFIQAVDIDGDGRPDLVASGLTRGQVVWYQNPSWTKRTIVSLTGRKPVAVDAADLTGDGLPDLVLCHDYGKCMFDCGPQDGKISWLQNPGPPGQGRPDTPWTRRHVADLVSTHRLRLGHFTTDRRLQLAALPVVGPQGGETGVHSPVRIMVYDLPDDVLTAEQWTGRAVDSSHFTVVHGVVSARFPGTPRPDRESFLLASAEGISWLGPGPGAAPDSAWKHFTLGTGVPPQKSAELNRYFRGSGNLAVGRIGGRSCAVIVSLEPFHGNTVAAYVRPDGTASPFARPWRRAELKVFPRPDQKYDAVGHHVVAADFDNDGDDEFLVAMRGPAPAQGVWYYKLDARGNTLVEQQVSTESTARIAVADFNGDGRLDFATTAYDTVGYYEIKDPKVRLYTNAFAWPGPVTPPPGGDG
ncbi:VCBS repeat-containing protein [Streptomyces sp. TRM70350]|uniref:FG-GAP repeat domain-containing protein n=1 Tax=Streptomyces sp. TRM70350 TaxID=2856165 RepID=UPI001C450BB2|nr:VCBS repeat-containing protein [Streptomyces sp. TRM70350]MBV7695881.1 VCBS repeat-containing protein [Streptomyces sp. TRM70350]